MSEKSSRRLLALLLVGFYLFSLASSATPQTQPGSPSLQVPNTRAVERIIQNLISSMNRSPDIHYREAKLINVMLFTSFVDFAHPEIEPPPSNNIQDFYSVGCLFRDENPQRAPTADLEFWVQNRWPSQWQRWSIAQDTHVTSPTAYRSFSWSQAISQMPIGVADRLIKAQGHRGRYSWVALLDFRAPPYQLMWCFKDVEGPGYRPGDEKKDIAVVVGSGEIIEDPLVC